MTFNIDNVPSQKGTVAIVTGANIGIGFETARALAKKEATVIMACRNTEKANSARDEILKEVPGADLHVFELDLSKLKSVKNFAESFLKQFDQLNLLINNAGIMVPPYIKTEDGFESQMGTNYFGHFHLTSLLLDTLEKTEGARIVSLSSIAHRTGKIHFNDIHFNNKYSRVTAYNQSKLACLMFAYELDRNLKKRGYNTLSVAAHPGVSNTNLGQHIPKFLYSMFVAMSSFVTHSPVSAAQPTLYAALGENVQGGDYYGPTGFNEMKGTAGKVTSKPQSHDMPTATKLWNLSEELTNTYFFGI